MIIVRNGHPCALSMVQNGHVKQDPDADSLLRARVMQARGLMQILLNCESYRNVYIITYEALIHEPPTLQILLQDLGLPPVDAETVRDENAKHYS